MPNLNDIMEMMGRLGDEGDHYDSHVLRRCAQPSFLVPQVRRCVSGRRFTIEKTS